MTVAPPSIIIGNICSCLKILTWWLPVDSCGVGIVYGKLPGGERKIYACQSIFFVFMLTGHNSSRVNWTEYVSIVWFTIELSTGHSGHLTNHTGRAIDGICMNIISKLVQCKTCHDSPSSSMVIRTMLFRNWILSKSLGSTVSSSSKKATKPSVNSTSVSSTMAVGGNVAGICPLSSRAESKSVFAEGTN